MIGLLQGEIVHMRNQALVVLVSGVGYVVEVPVRLISASTISQNITLYVHTHVREDNIQLYGFTSEAELNLFELLLGVSGVGPKSALLVVDRGVEPVREAIRTAEVSFFTSIPRLGTKNAQKIIIELKSKIGSTTELDLRQDDANQELVQALSAMGFSRVEALTSAKGVPKSVQSLEDKVRYALKSIAQKQI